LRGVAFDAHDLIVVFEFHPFLAHHGVRLSGKAGVLAALARGSSDGAWIAPAHDTVFRHASGRKRQNREAAISGTV